MCNVQEMYLQSVNESQNMHQVQTAELNAKLDAIATTEVLAVSRPPASFPLPTPHPDPKNVGHAVAEITDLRRGLVDTRQQLEDTLRARDNLSSKLTNSEVCDAPLHCNLGIAFVATFLF